MIYYISSNEYLLSCIYLLHDVLLNYLPCHHCGQQLVQDTAKLLLFSLVKWKCTPNLCLMLIRYGFPRKKYPKHLFFWTVVSKGGCLTEICSSILRAGGWQNCPFTPSVDPPSGF